MAGVARRDAAGRLAGLRLIVTPATIVRWHRDIVRSRWALLSRRGRSGRPPVRRTVRSVVLRMARENESWACPACQQPVTDHGPWDDVPKKTATKPTARGAPPNSPPGKRTTLACNRLTPIFVAQHHLAVRGLFKAFWGAPV